MDDDHHRRLIIGLALVLGMLFVIPFGAMTMSGFVTAPTAGGQQANIATPVFLGMIICSAGILYFVFRAKK